MPKSFRIALISPYSSLESIGLRIISTCLKQAGYETILIFLPDLDERTFSPMPYPEDYPPAVLAQVCELCAGAGLVGVSVMSYVFGRARALTQAIHERLGLPVIWGGVHPTVRPEESLQWADYVCVGEGEDAMLDLVNALAGGGDVTNIPNIWLTDDQGQVIANPIRPLNHDLDFIPLPDYDPVQHFVWHDGCLQPVTDELLSAYQVGLFTGKLYRIYRLTITRSCPFDCTYCSESAYSKIYPDWRHIRRRSPENVVAEIDAARRLLPDLQAVMFMDSTFLALSTEAVQRFSQVYREQVGLPFFIMTTPGSLTEEKIRPLVEAGLQDIELGIQAGNLPMRRLFHRRDSDEQIIAAVRLLKRFSGQIQYTRFDIITDNPYETHAQKQQTLQFLARLEHPSIWHIFSLAFFPGTALNERARADGLIRDEEHDVYFKNVNQLTPTYYNFLLWLHNRRLPRALMKVLIAPPTFNALESPAARWLFRFVWKGIYALRVRRKRRDYLNAAC